MNYLGKNWQKIIYIILITVILLFCCFFNLIIKNFADKLVNNRQYDIALNLYKILLRTTLPSSQKAQHINSIAICYLMKKDINSAITTYEQGNLKPSIYRSSLADLYIAKGEYGKAENIGFGYKICFLKEDWQCVLDGASKLKEADNRLQIPMIINSQLDFDRAYAYRRLGKNQEADEIFYEILRHQSNEKLKEYYRQRFMGDANYYKELYANMRRELGL